MKPLNAPEKKYSEENQLKKSFAALSDSGCHCVAAVILLSSESPPPPPVDNGEVERNPFSTIEK